MKLSGKRVAILATDGFEQSELFEPLQRLKQEGATVEIVAPEAGEIRGWSKGDWSDTIRVDKTVDEVSASDYGALIVPGGVINPDKLRMIPRAVALVREMVDSGKPVSAICHGVWLLAEAEALDGKVVTSWPSIQTDLRNAGAEWVDEEVVVDDNLVTSRGPRDLPAFCDRIVEVIAEGGGEIRAAS